MTDHVQTAPVGSGLRVLAWTTAISAVLAMVTPTMGDGEPPIAGGAVTVVFIAAMLVPLFVGAARASAAVGRGLLVGSCIFLVAFCLLLVSLVVAIASAFAEFDGAVSYGPGFALMIITTILGTITALVGVRGGRGLFDGGNGTRMAGGLRLVGVLGAIGIVVGVMLPPPNSYLTFDQINFEWGDQFVQFAYLVFVVATGASAFIGFLDGSRRGLAMVAAGTLPITWILVLTLFEVGTPDGAEVGFSQVLRDQIHPVFAIAAGVVVAVWVIAAVTMSSSSTAALPPPSRAAAEQRPDQDAPASTSARRVRPATEPSVDAGPAPPDTEVGPTLTAPLPSAPTVASPSARSGPATPTAPPPPFPAGVETVGRRPVIGDGFGLRSMSTGAAGAGGDRSPEVGEPDITVTSDAAPFGPVVSFGDGRRRVLIGTLIVGRDPVPAPDDEYPVVVATADRKVSKTHLAVGLRRDGSLWVEDRHSTNGVMVEPPHRTCRRLDPGVRTAVPSGTCVWFGDSMLTIGPAH